MNFRAPPIGALSVIRVSWFSEFETAHLKQAKALLEELSH